MPLVLVDIRGRSLTLKDDHKSLAAAHITHHATSHVSQTVDSLVSFSSAKPTVLDKGRLGLLSLLHQDPLRRPPTPDLIDPNERPKYC